MRKWRKRKIRRATHQSKHCYQSRCIFIIVCSAAVVVYPVVPGRENKQHTYAISWNMPKVNDECALAFMNKSTELRTRTIHHWLNRELRVIMRANNLHRSFWDIYQCLCFEQEIPFKRKWNWVQGTYRTSGHRIEANYSFHIRFSGYYSYILYGNLLI